jgi:salicylate hydroxylase
VDAGLITTVDGTSFYGDAIVCADGMHSRSRSFILGDDVRSEPSGESAYRFLVRREDLQAINHPMLVNGCIPGSLTMVNGPGRKLVAYPVRGGTVLNVAAYIREPPPYLLSLHP